MKKKMYVKLMSYCGYIDVILLCLCVCPMLLAMPMAWRMMVETASWVELIVWSFGVVALFLLVAALLFGGYSRRMRIAVLERPDRKPSTKTAEIVGGLVLLVSVLGLAYVHANAFAFWFGLNMPVEVLARLDMSVKFWASNTGGANQWFYDGVSRCMLVISLALMGASIALHTVMWHAEQYDLTDDEMAQEAK